MAWNVCLAADNEAIQHLFSRTFENREDISLKFCETAEETFREVEENPPHLLIVSINLPDKDGYDLCGELKERGVSFPIVLIEDIFEDIDLDRCLEVQTDGFIAKPFEEDLIAEKVNEVLASQEEEKKEEEKEGIDSGPGVSAEEEADQEEVEEVEEETETPEEAASAFAYGEEESPVTELATSEEEEGIVELTDLIMEGEEEPSVEEVFLEEEEVPPAIASALEESASELAKMEAMETPPESMSVPEPEVASPAEEISSEPVQMEAPTMPAMNREELEKMISEIVGRQVEETLREKLPGILKESLSGLFSELSESLK